VIPPEKRRGFVANIEQVLDVYKMPYNAEFPVVYFPAESHPGFECLSCPEIGLHICKLKIRIKWKKSYFNPIMTKHSKEK